MISAVIFDLYGTLLEMPKDSLPFHVLARRLSRESAADALGSCLISDNATLQDYCTSIGLSSQSDIDALEASLSQDLDAIRPYPDVVRVLEGLRVHGISIALISNLATPYKRPLTDHGLSQLFDVEVLSCDVGLIKPDARIYGLALERLGIPADQTLMVGDSYKCDVLGPRGIGISGIHLVRSGDGSPDPDWITTLDPILGIAT